MKLNEQNISLTILNLLKNQQLAVLATVENDHPHTSLMAFIVSDDLKTLVVATTTSTRKYKNIIENANVALLVDNRAETETDFQSAMALSIFGTAKPVGDSERDDYMTCYRDRHPSLKGFLQADSTALIKIEVSHYALVTEFQDVSEYRP